MKSNQKKSAQLGMPFGTAANKLRKLVLFHLLKKHNENICFRCSELISDASHLSVEHKKAWQNVDASLFWDMDNIAFSHLSCNAAASSGARGIISRLHPSSESYKQGCRCDECRSFEKLRRRAQRAAGIKT